MNKKTNGKMLMIEEDYFPEKTEGMTLVDAYYIPDEEVDEYRKDREYYAQKAAEIFAKHCYSVTRDWKGSQDGEAILGLNEEGTLIMLVHLDPDDVHSMKEADAEGELEKFLLETNSYTAPEE